MHTLTRLGRCAFRLLVVFLLGGACVCPAAEAPPTILPNGFVAQEIVAEGWWEPVGVAFDPSPERANRVYVWERTGSVYIVENGVKSLLLSISWEVGGYNDYGMLGVALHPNFSQNGYIYLFYVVDRYDVLNAGSPNYDYTANLYHQATIGRITRYTCKASDGFRSVDLNSRVVLLGESKTTGIPVLHNSHGVGHLAFGTDGTLLASVGDAASWEGMDDGGPDGNSLAVQGLADGIIKPKEDVGAFRSQLVDSLSGKILRLDPETGNGVPSNPFYDAANPRAPKSRVWALGLRNPCRMTVKPGTGSHNPADGNPGVIVLSDVGYETWEEVDVITGPGQNLGWPLFEGLTPSPADYQGSPAVNLDAPNPIGGYFRFKDLIVQETLGTPSWPNPSDPSQQIPASIPRFVHKRPVIDVGREVNGPARAATFSGNTATQTLIGPAGSPVTGPQFEANAGTGGTFYTGTAFPAMYHGTYFFADYGRQWIKNMVFDANHRPVEVRDFATLERPVFVAAHPTTGALYSVSLTDDPTSTTKYKVRRIEYAPGGNRLPVAKASANVTHGASPLAVNFSSAGSSDPEGTALTYRWTFGDGTTSTAANPAKTFNSSTPVRYDVKLVVTDAGGASAEAALPVFVNHTPPTVQILSPVNNTKYALDEQSTYSLIRSATAAPGRTTSTKWQVYLHHDDHVHTDAVIDAVESSATIAGVDSPTSTYSYEVVCTVTDDLGAVTEARSLLRPNKNNVAPALAWSIASQQRADGAGVVILDANATASDADSTGLEFGKLQLASTVQADIFSIVPQGDGAGQVGLAGTAVRYGGVDVATISGGASGLTFEIAFRTNVTPAIAQAILRRVALECGSVGVRSVTAKLFDGDGGTSTTATLAVSAGDTVLPAEWQTRDIGIAATPGSVTFVDGTYSAASSGSGFGTTDSFHFISQPEVGDVEIIARVANVNSASPGALAGIMVRENRAANARNAFVGLKPGPTPAGVFEWRSDPVAPARQKPLPTGAAPQWLRMVRHGARCTAYTSVDGEQWDQVRTIALLLPSKVFVGLAVAGGSASGEPATTVFDHVTVSPVPVSGVPLAAFTNPADGASFAAPGPVTFDIRASDPNGGVARVDLLMNGKKLGSDTKAPFSFSWSPATAGTHQFSARAVDFTGKKSVSSPISVTVTPDPNALPTPWRSRDVGAPASPGTASFASGAFTVSSAGDDLLGTSDQGRFVWQSWTGDGTLIARVASVSPTNPAALGAVMFRENFGAGSKFVSANLTSSQGAVLSYRTEPGTESALGTARPVAAPRWLRIVRRGTRFSAAVSADGVTWQSLGAITATMPTTCRVGLFVSAGAGGESTTAVFDSITVLSPTGE